MKYLQPLIAACIIFFLGMSTCAAQNGTGDVDAVTLTWAESARTTQTITWRTDVNSPNVFLEYSEADVAKEEPSSVHTVQAEVSSLVTDQGPIQLNTVTLRGLKPAMRYVYRIGSGENWLKNGAFSTEQAVGGFTFLLFGDSQSIDYDVWENTFENACRNHPEARFFVNVGDLVDNGQTDREWQAWHRSVAAYAGALPVIPVVGNHETYTPEANFSMPYYFTKQFAVPQNGPDGLRGQVYSFDYGDVHFVILDSQFGEERRFLPDSLTLQKAWLAEDLARTNQQWKVVFVHRPVYHNRLSEANPDGNMEQFTPIFEAYGVDAVFSGHDHVNARTPRLAAGVPSQQGVVYATVGRSGTKTYKTVGPRSWNVQFSNLLDHPTYSVVSVIGNGFFVRVFTQDGTLIDEWSLTKSDR